MLLRHCFCIPIPEDSGIFWELFETSASREPRCNWKENIAFMASVCSFHLAAFCVGLHLHSYIFQQKSGADQNPQGYLYESNLRPITVVTRVWVSTSKDLHTPRALPARIYIHPGLCQQGFTYTPVMDVPCPQIKRPEIGLNYTALPCAPQIKSVTTLAQARGLHNSTARAGERTNPPGSGANGSAIDRKSNEIAELKLADEAVKTEEMEEDLCEKGWTRHPV